MGRLKIDFGIDLGTTNSALAFISEGNIEVKELDRSKIVPSCVHFDRKGGVRVGITALNCQPNFLEFKRKMGTDWKEKKNPEIDEYVNAEELSSEVLKKLKSSITDEYFKSVVVTVPAMFDMNQVAATKRAGELAGFEQVEILMEPVAAAFAYSFKHKIQDAKYIVFDFGGGTFDAALVKSEGGVLTVVSSEGDNHLGGKDLDLAIVNNLLLPLLKSSYNIDSFDSAWLDDLTNTKLKRLADNLKIELSSKDSFDILTNLGELGSDANGLEMEIDKTFTVAECDQVLEGIFQKAIDCTKKLISVNNLQISDITALVLVGGPTQILRFRRMIEEQIMKPDTSLNPMTAIAEGAALYAAQFNNTAESHGNKIGGSWEDNAVKKIELEIEYAATSVNTKEPIGIKRKSTSDSYSVVIKNKTSNTQSTKVQLDDVILVDIDSKRPNSFVIELYSSSNDPVPCTPSEFVIIPGITVDGGAPIPYNIGMEIIHSTRGKVFTPFKGLEKDKKLPLVGQTDRDLYTSSELRPGIATDIMVIPIYLAERDAKDSRSIINVYADTIEINGNDVSTHIPEGTLVEFTMRIDISQNMTLEIEFPKLNLDPIIKKMKFPQRQSVKKEQIEMLFKEIETTLQKLRESEEIYHSMDNLISKQSFWKSQYNLILNDDFEQIFSDLRSFLLEVDNAMDEIKWPILKREIIKELADFEVLATKTKANQIQGWEKDENDVDHFKRQRDQLFAMSKIDFTQAEKLKDNIRDAALQAIIRVQGKQLFIDMIKSFNRDFNSIDWKDSTIARQEVNRGMDLANSGADEDKLRSQLSTIINQMKSPDLAGIPKL